ncbi:hypothetical protein ACFQY7_30275 [Actinomadura luteofluorescens]|uniref:hypothetical protein n=1 Tax=Actinomadura luteofluorescens TaxID=46163 RepID=UPI003636D8F2
MHGVPAPAATGGGFADQVDMRFDRTTMGWLDGRPSGRPDIRAYFRHACGQEPDGYSLALAVDALPPVALNLGAQGWAPTVELTWHMRAVPAPGWLAVHGTGRLLAAAGSTRRWRCGTAPPPRRAEPADRPRPPRPLLTGATHRRFGTTNERISRHRRELDGFPVRDGVMSNA